MGKIHAIMSDGTIVTNVEVCTSSVTDMLLFKLSTSHIFYVVFLEMTS